MRIVLVYIGLFGATGILLPYLPPYLKGLGFTGTEIAVVGALPAALQIGAPLLFGFAADRTRRPVWILRIAAAGAAVAFSPMLLVHGFVAVALVMAGYAVFSTTISPLSDTVAVVEARRLGTDYARLRLWGSIAFIATSYAFGAWLSGAGHARDVVPFGLALLVVTALATFALRPGVPAPKVPHLAEARALMRRPALLWFLAAAMLHWAALGPFHVLFAIHLADLGVDPRSTGAGLAIAVAAEVVVMWSFRRIRQWLPLYPLLALAFVSSALRWFLTARLDGGVLLAAVQAIHGLSFGAFFVASIAHLERTVPEHLRATGRTLFGAVGFGIGGVIGILGAGMLYDAGGGRLAFEVAAVVDLLAPLCLLAAWLAGRGAPERASTAGTS